MVYGIASRHQGPSRVPHWVKKIEGKEIVYIVVKIAK
jgi:hypothetical protein